MRRTGHFWGPPAAEALNRVGRVCVGRRAGKTERLPAPHSTHLHRMQARLTWQRLQSVPRAFCFRALPALQSFCPAAAGNVRLAGRGGAVLRANRKAGGAAALGLPLAHRPRPLHPPAGLCSQVRTGGAPAPGPPLCAHACAGACGCGASLCYLLLPAGTAHSFAILQWQAF